MLNNIEIKKFIYVVLAVLVVTVGATVLAGLGIDVPVLRQVAGFILLSIVPGALIMRILKVHNIGTAESLAYSVGLSLAFVMFSGLLLNFTFSALGTVKPISMMPLLAMVSGLVLVLTLFAYVRDRKFVPPKPVKPSAFLSRPALVFAALLALVIAGTLLVNYYQSNGVLLLAILMIAAFLILVAFTDLVPETSYPGAMLSIGLVLLYSSTLSSSYISGYDIQAELFVQNTVVQSGHWDPSVPGNLNTSLSIVMLAPIYSLILGMDAVWVFKIIYPLFFSLVPLALFQAYREQVGSKVALLSTFFFMSMVVFFQEMTTLNRQQVAELFLALLVLLMVDKSLTRAQKSVLGIVFAISLPVSHYGLAYVSLLLFGAGWLLVRLSRVDKATMLWRRVTGNDDPPAEDGVPVTPDPPALRGVSMLTGTLVFLYVVFTLFWYIYTASGTMFTSVIRIPQHIYGSLSEFFNPVTRESLVAAAVGLDFPTVSGLGRAFRVVQYTTQGLIIIGFLRLLFKPRPFKFTLEFAGLAIASMSVLAASVLLPYFSGKLEVERLYHIALFLLAPMCIVGAATIGQGISRVVKRFAPHLRPGDRASPAGEGNLGRPVHLWLLTALVLVPYFLFNTGFLFEVTRSTRYDVVDTPSSEALSSYRMDMKAANFRENAAIDWLVTGIDDGTPVFADVYATLPIGSRLYGRTRAFPTDATRIPPETYIFLKTWNLTRGEVVFMMTRGERIWHQHVAFEQLPDLTRLIVDRNLVYDNGGARILAP